MSNPLNNGHVIGRLASDPAVFENADGSKKVRFTVIANRNYTNRAGDRLSDAIDIEHYVSNGGSMMGIDRVHKGDQVAVDYELRKDVYTKKSGEKVYEMKVIFSGLSFLEPRTVTQERLAKRAAEAATAQPTEQDARIAELMAQNEVLRQQAQTQQPVPAAVPAQPSLQDDLPF